MVIPSKTTMITAEVLYYGTKLTAMAAMLMMVRVRKTSNKTV